MTDHIEKSPQETKGGDKIHPNEQRIVWDMYFSSVTSGLASHPKIKNINIEATAQLADAMWAERCKRFK